MAGSRWWGADGLGDGMTNSSVCSRLRYLLGSGTFSDKTMNVPGNSGSVGHSTLGPKALPRHFCPMLPTGPPWLPSSPCPYLRALPAQLLPPKPGRRNPGQVELRSRRREDTWAERTSDSGRHILTRPGTGFLENPGERLGVAGRLICGVQMATS